MLAILTEKSARLEYERWEYAVERWLSENEDKVEKFRNSSTNAPQIQVYYPEANGHKAIESFFI